MKDEPGKFDAEKTPAYTPASTGKRIAALLGALFMVVLTLVYAYSVATGGILAW